MFRSNSTISSSSRIEPLDIINEEDFSVEETNSSVDWNQWTIPRIQPSSIYQTSWLKTKLSFNSKFKVKTVEQNCEVSNVQEKYNLFTKKSIQEFLSKGYKFLHIGFVQIAVKTLTRIGINASILLFYFDCFPDLPLTLNDPNILMALTLNIDTSGYDMIKGSKPLAVIYRIYYKVLKSTLNPKTVSKSTGNKTLLIQSSTPDANIQVPRMIHWKDITLPKEWILEREVPPAPVLTNEPELDIIQQYLDGTVNISFDQTPLPSFRRNSFAGSRSSFIPTLENHERRDQNLNIFLKDSAKVAQPVLNNSALKMKGLSMSSQITSAFYSAKDVETSKGKSIKDEANKDDENTSTLSPIALDMAASIAPLLSQLCVINKNCFELDIISLFKDYNSKENRDKRKTYHATFSDFEKSRVKRKWKENMYADQKHILFFDFLENHYVLKTSLNVLKIDFVKEEGRTTVKSSHPPSKAIDISHLGVDLTASPFKTSKANKIEKHSTSALTSKEEEDGFIQTTNEDLSESDSSTIKNIDLFEKNFQGDDLKIAGLESKPNPMSFTRNWYSKPTPPDLQFEEKIFQSQSSYSADKTYEWNIDGMFEQEILNTMSKMSLVANAYINNII
ncbi:hypothetical protein I3843_05G137400 [Carya illinoinensis]|nr:hypothetical protein I3843_05G137400 [Carya illinoinensis]